MINDRSLKQLLDVVLDLRGSFPTVFVFVADGDIGFDVDVVATAGGEGGARGRAWSGFLGCQACGFRQSRFGCLCRPGWLWLESGELPFTNE